MLKEKAAAVYIWIQLFLFTRASALNNSVASDRTSLVSHEAEGKEWEFELMCTFVRHHV